MEKRNIVVFSLNAFLALVLTACNLAVAPPNDQEGAYLGGTITADLNSNGTSDSGEGPLENVIVLLSGCGEAKTALSGADGSFSFSGLPTGVCILEVTKGGWSYSASYPTPGYPIPVAADASQPFALAIFMRPADQIVKFEYLPG